MAYAASVTITLATRSPNSGPFVNMPMTRTAPTTSRASEGPRCFLRGRDRLARDRSGSGTLRRRTGADGAAADLKRGASRCHASPTASGVSTTGRVWSMSSRLPVLQTMTSRLQPPSWGWSTKHSTGCTWARCGPAREATASPASAALATVCSRKRPFWRSTPLLTVIRPVQFLVSMTKMPPGPTTTWSMLARGRPGQRTSCSGEPAVGQRGQDRAGGLLAQASAFPVVGLPLQPRRLLACATCHLVRRLPRHARSPGRWSDQGKSLLAARLRIGRIFTIGAAPCATMSPDEGATWTGCASTVGTRAAVTTRLTRSSARAAASR